jgi:hypothetical protein
MELSEGMRGMINETYDSHIKLISGTDRLEKLIEDVSKVCITHKPSDDIKAHAVHAIHAELITIMDQLKKPYKK